MAVFVAAVCVPVRARVRAHVRAATRSHADSAHHCVPHVVVQVVCVRVGHRVCGLHWRARAGTARCRRGVLGACACVTADGRVRLVSGLCVRGRYGVARLASWAACMSGRAGGLGWAASQGRAGLGCCGSLLFLFFFCLFLFSFFSFDSNLVRV